MSLTSRMRQSLATQRLSRPSQMRRFMMSRRSAQLHPDFTQVRMTSPGLRVLAHSKPANLPIVLFLLPLAKSMERQRLNSPTPLT
uniref:Macaca fascicularis brain cDNA clone: QmoA-11651, similar to human microtubule-associated protein 1A (MAP1A), mRNA, RefSeq: NM_002373.4 n=1 Tax=Macaca fascicularis TaxID=9541 RepID=I7G8J1_MACFA|nr:unnamed protein product [Macaca fascicularis]